MDSTQLTLIESVTVIAPPLPTAFPQPGVRVPRREPGFVRSVVNRARPRGGTPTASAPVSDGRFFDRLQRLILVRRHLVNAVHRHGDCRSRDCEVRFWLPFISSDKLRVADAGARYRRLICSSGINA